MVINNLNVNTFHAQVKGIEEHLKHQQEKVESTTKVMRMPHVVSRVDGLADIDPVALGLADDTSFW